MWTLEQLAAEGDAADKQVDHILAYLVKARKCAKLIATIRKRKERDKEKKLIKILQKFRTDVNHAIAVLNLPIKAYGIATPLLRFQSYSDGIGGGYKYQR